MYTVQSVSFPASYTINAMRACIFEHDKDYQLRKEDISKGDTVQVVTLRKESDFYADTLEILEQSGRTIVRGTLKTDVKKNQDSIIDKAIAFLFKKDQQYQKISKKYKVDEQKILELESEGVNIEQAFAGVEQFTEGIGLQANKGKIGHMTLKMIDLVRDGKLFQ